MRCIHYWWRKASLVKWRFRRNGWGLAVDVSEWCCREGMQEQIQFSARSKTQPDLACFLVVESNRKGPVRCSHQRWTKDSLERVESKWLQIEKSVLLRRWVNSDLTVPLVMISFVHRRYQNCNRGINWKRCDENEPNWETMYPNFWVNFTPFWLKIVSIDTGNGRSCDWRCVSIDWILVGCSDMRLVYVELEKESFRDGEIKYERHH